MFVPRVPAARRALWRHVRVGGGDLRRQEIHRRHRRRRRTEEDRLAGGAVTQRLARSVVDDVDIDEIVVATVRGETGDRVLGRNRAGDEHRIGVAVAPQRRVIRHADGLVDRIAAGGREHRRSAVVGDVEDPRKLHRAGETPRLVALLVHRRGRQPRQPQAQAARRPRCGHRHQHAAVDLGQRQLGVNPAALVTLGAHVLETEAVEGDAPAAVGPLAGRARPAATAAAGSQPRHDADHSQARATHGRQYARFAPGRGHPGRDLPGKRSGASAPRRPPRFRASPPARRSLYGRA